MKRRVAPARSLHLRLFATETFTSGRENRGAILGGVSFRAQRGISPCAEVDRSSRRTGGVSGRKNQSAIPRCARNDNAKG